MQKIEAKLEDEGDEMKRFIFQLLILKFFNFRLANQHQISYRPNHLPLGETAGLNLCS